MTEDETVEWHHQLSGHEFKQTLGNSERQGSLACYSPWSRKDLNMTWRLHNSNKDFPDGAHFSPLHERYGAYASFILAAVFQSMGLSINSRSS